MASKVAIAMACHPDDIEFMMAGTLIRLRDAGYEIHYMNIANGSLGTHIYDYKTIVKMRREEAVEAAKIIGAHYHESVCDDLEVFYNYETLAKIVPVVREVAPDIVLTHGPYDYMEDHTNAGRLAVSAAFCRGMINFKCARPVKAIDKAVTVYHSMPHSMSDQLRKPLVPGVFVDITSTTGIKEKMLVCHRSQKDWLDVSQGSGSYVKDMLAKSEYVGKLSKRFAHSEGWIRHNPIGFCAPDADPLTKSLAPGAFVNEDFEKNLKLEF